MVIRNHKISTLSTVYLVADMIVLIAFVFLPWISVASGQNVFSSASGLTLPFKLFGLTNELKSYSFINSDAAASVTAQLTAMGVISLVFYTIPVFLGVALYELFQNDEKAFGSYSRLGFISGIIAGFFLFLIRIMILHVVDVNTGSEAIDALIGSSISSLIPIRYGGYLEFIVCIVALIVPYVMRSEERPNYREDFSHLKNSASRIKKIKRREERKQTATPGTFAKRDKVLTGNLEPTIKLIGSGVDVDIYALPSVLGRSIKEADVTIQDQTVSRKHCQFLVYEDMVLVEDLGSTHGTVLAGENLIPGKFYRISDGDFIQFGNAVCTISLNADRVRDEITSRNLDDTPPPPKSSMEETAKLAPAKPSVERRPPQRPPIPDAPRTQQPIDLDDPEMAQVIYEKTVSLMDMSTDVPTQRDANKTVKINYDGGSTRFPTMSMQSRSDYFLMNKTPYIVGSDENRVDHVLKQRGVSKQHAKLHRENDQFYITDLNSTNGVKINGKSIAAGEATRLNVGDMITIGEEEYRFEDA